MNKPVETQVKIHELIANRWSPRAFDANKQVSLESLVTLAESARWSPSCFGDQPWYYIFFNKHQDENAWNKAFECLAEGNQSWVKNAPVIAIAVANTNFHHNGKPNAWAEYDTGASAMALCLQAVALGLSTHQMAGFNPQKAKELFNIEDNFKPLAMIAIGYESENIDELLSETYANLEKSPRKRNPLGQQFFLNGWKNPIA